ncbi:hypothetical protein PG991_006698 [Apiospora marii]|uniref:O-methyltransferase C-terminal domain-containing protein n=1 Tax=Apiospora marii TaxID=335849 RepID=A0ABR1RZV4_9PEZI
MAAQTIQQLSSLHPGDFATEAERFEAKEAARGLLARLETPFERAWYLAAEQPVFVAGLMTLKNLGIWTRWAQVEKERGPGSNATLAEILSWCNAKVEPNLLRRFLRHLAATFVVKECDVDTWRPTPFSLSLGDEVGKMVQVAVDHTYLGGLNLPKFLAKHGYVEPIDLTKFDNYTEVYGDIYWDRCEKEPAVADSFRAIMTGLTATKLDWTEVYDTNRLVSGAVLSPSSSSSSSSSSSPPPPALFVDVAGLHGMDTQRLLSRHPSLPAGLLFVQDLPEVVDVQAALDREPQQRQAGAAPRLDPRITRMKHDFYQPQPLRGARAYFLHTVLHDWPDANCIRILESVKGAMKPGYSKLLLYEVVMPPKGATTMAATMDMSLMSMNSGMERTEAHWAQMLGGVGLKIVRIDRNKRAVESVIEAELI